MNATPTLPPRPLPTYPYHVLCPNTIRLIRIHQGAAADPLVCTLEVATLTQLPAYEALSYCWGAVTENLPTISLHWHAFEVTENLHAALLRLRRSTESRLLWVDAVCINQKDVQECNSQVVLMDQIYRRANEVVIWLGGPVVVDGQDIWSIPPLLEAAQMGLKRNQLPIHHGAPDWAKPILINNVTVNGDLQDRKWNAILKGLILLLQRPWFLRTWIVQEVTLAKHAIVVCGQNSISWDDFYCALSYAIDLEYLSSTLPEMHSSARSIERARQLLADDRYQCPLDLLASFRIFLATKSQDKVFGIYGLFSPSDRATLLKQDYTLGPVDVYTQVAIDCIKMEGNLDVLSLGGMDCHPDHTKLPTWAPDWAFAERAKPLHPRFISVLSFGAYRWDPSTARSATSNSSELFFCVSEDKTVLTLSGHIVDSISKVGGVLEQDYYESQPSSALLTANLLLQKSFDVVREWEDICGLHQNRPYPYLAGETAWDTYWKTLHAGCYPNDDARKAKEIFEKWYRPFRHLRELTDCSVTVDEISKSDAGVPSKIVAGAGWFGKIMYKSMKIGVGMMRNRWVEQSDMRAVHRTMFRTQTGYIGLSSRNIQDGDRVVLFQGASMPFVIREKGTGWVIIGDAYVHGIMNGEAFDQSKCLTFDIY